MFTAAVSQFVKTVGNGELISPPDLDEASRCVPLHLVVKKNKRWFWQQASYLPSEYEVNQICTDDTPLPQDSMTTSRKLTTYKQNHKLSLSGKVGAELKKVLDIELKASEKIEMKSDFGDITKVEIDQVKLRDLLKDRKVDLSSSFIESMRSDGGKVVCVVVGTAKVTLKGTITACKEKKGDLTPNMGKASDVDAQVDDTNSFTLTVEKDTPLGFHVLEIFIKDDGSMLLREDRQETGGFESLTQGDDSLNELIKNDLSMTQQFHAIVELSAEERMQVVMATLALCKSGHNDVDAVLLIMIKKKKVPTATLR